MNLKTTVWDNLLKGDLPAPPRDSNPLYLYQHTDYETKQTIQRYVLTHVRKLF